MSKKSEQQSLWISQEESQWQDPELPIHLSGMEESRMQQLVMPASTHEPSIGEKHHVNTGRIRYSNGVVISGKTCNFDIA